MKKYIVLIPAYNSEKKELEKTINSIPDSGDILIIDDGSNIGIEEIVLSSESIVKKNRISFFRNSINMGIEETLKKGVELVKYKYEYLVRLDVGDMIIGDRIEKQVTFLDGNLDYGIVGCWTEYVDDKGNLMFKSQLPVENNSINKKMYVNNMFVHPAVTMRVSTILEAGNYRSIYKACEDYDLFFRMLKISKGYNIPEFLMRYEVSFTSISSKKRNLQVLNRIKIILRNFQFFRFGIMPYYGLLRGGVMLLIGREVTTFLRKIISK